METSKNGFWQFRASHVRIGNQTIHPYMVNSSFFRDKLDKNSMLILESHR